MCIGILAVKKLSRNDVLYVMFVYMISTINLTVPKMDSQYELQTKAINQNVGKQKKLRNNKRNNCATRTCKPANRASIRR